MRVFVSFGVGTGIDNNNRTCADVVNRVSHEHTSTPHISYIQLLVVRVTFSPYAAADAADALALGCLFCLMLPIHSLLDLCIYI